jgi:hypothetical protein
VLSLPTRFTTINSWLQFLPPSQRATLKYCRRWKSGPDQRLLVCLAGQKFIYDDGMTKTFEERLDHPDIKDMFYQTYPLANPTDRLPKDFDPGRCRVEALFMTLWLSDL